MRRSETGPRKLTREQVSAIVDPCRLVHVEASPGSGKTTVAAQRFGLHRFTPTGDHRAVVAVCFARSATEELRGRIGRQWGATALAWPHRVVTLDTLLCDLLSHLLRSGVLMWPGGHHTLDVLDTWQMQLVAASTRTKPVLCLDGTRVAVGTSERDESRGHPAPDEFTAAIERGICTHENVREVLDSALAPSGVARAAAVAWLQQTTRSLLVDEAYDANDLDLTFIRLATEADVAVTLVGDRWQALYEFRGAKPAEVATLVKQSAFTMRTLHNSFRWSTPSQKALAQRLRFGQSVVLPAGRLADADVVLACLWKTLWNVGSQVLPLAVKARRPFQKALCTLLLNELVLDAFSQPAVFVHDARVTLGIGEGTGHAQLRPFLQSSLDRLADGEKVVAVWDGLEEAVVATTGYDLAHRQPEVPRTALGHLSARHTQPRHRLVPGMTCHQAKGREWDRVGVALTVPEAHALRTGLDHGQQVHRALYVALTRAREESFAV